MKSLLLLALVIACATARSEEATEREELRELLKDGVEGIHHLWEHSMGKPPLDYDRLRNEKLPTFLYGKWAGSGEWRDLADVELRKDGTWRSQHFRSNLKNGSWFLIDGMILLFDGPIKDKDTRLASALIMKDGKMRLLNAVAKKGYVVLKKQRTALRRR